MSDVIIFSAFLKDLYKKYLFEWLIYVCHRTVIEDLFYYITSDPDIMAQMINFSVSRKKSAFAIE